MPGNRHGLFSRQSCIEPMEVAGNGRDRPAGFGQIDALDCLIDEFAQTGVFLKKCISASTVLSSRGDGLSRERRKAQMEQCQLAKPECLVA